MTNRKDLIFKLAKGYFGRSKNCWRTTRNRVEHGLEHAYRGRKEKKRTMSSIWIQNVKAATEQHGVKYSQFMNGFVLSGCQINRKVLAELAQTEPLTMRALVALSVQARREFAVEFGNKDNSAGALSYELDFPVEAELSYEGEDAEVTRITEHLSKVFSDLVAKEYEEDKIYQQKLEQEIKDKKIKVTGDPIIV
ncbi:ribosomal protein L20 [Naegleria gruberi]|uniref:Ribosomal protein L20 n=1 Tax=Naegleria gruberi TaxID=5762 RepID=D2VNZ9_NAEGR|nr:ribosomal protein L20 [Naegleria gruberi]EFC41509.1 ribosomal protein L20 [Naegleria gruberi]|eukprot:XP_002674253.1 ribosomal protein L20 [Naegleria gruberi strain NEG-M]